MNKYQKVINQITKDHLEKTFMPIPFVTTRKAIRKKFKRVTNEYGYKSLRFSTLLKIKQYGKDHEFRA
ncbi:hypothetical protein [Clostridium pasteurianum]|uniref:Uncharacterized protein n=1 Tax=Clostridium pasteurianum BC1 TaxID=86416 RepID=R4K904_CLOPA|nr:hypothetical protein [Clostridium pasteurianum]AGK98196.1 hypothetical protein Clopa_3401 [Clostridium pasteurianum BC1]